METNELPEEVKRKIVRGAIDSILDRFGPPHRESDTGLRPEHGLGFERGAEFGYRLALQSKEEEIARLKKANDGWENADTIKDMNALIDSLTSEVERLKELNNKLRFASLDPSETGSSSKLEPTK